MRTLGLAFVLGIALACSGQPFTALADSEGDRAVTSGGSAGSPPGPADSSVAGSATVPDEPRGGAGTTASEGEPQTGGTASALAGAGGSDEGGAPATADCPNRVTGDWELGYFPELRDAATHESHPFFQVTNRGAITTLDRIAIRYYFTKESDVVETATCYWVTGDRCSLARFEFGDVPAPTADASRYLQVSFPGASNVTVTAGNLEVRVGFKTGSTPLIQSNDYSFDANAAAPSTASPFPYKRWPQTTLYVDGELAWGAEPCSSDRNTSTQ